MHALLALVLLADGGASVAPVASGPSSHAGGVLGALVWLSEGDNLKTAIGTVVAILLGVERIAAKLKLTRVSRLLGSAREEIEEHKDDAVQAKTATVACAAGLEESLKAGHIDRDTFDKVTRTIRTFSEDAGVEALLKPIVQAARAETATAPAETPPAEVVRRATARLTPGAPPAGEVKA